MKKTIICINLFSSIIISKEINEKIAFSPAQIDQSKSVLKFVSLISAKNFKFPSSSEIKSLLEFHNEMHFVANSTIARDLAGHWMTEKEVQNKVSEYQNRYIESLKENPGTQFLVAKMLEMKSFKEERISQLLITNYKRT